MNTNERHKTSARKRGFAAMDEARRREIASKGGQAAHKKGTAHEFTSDEAREAGRKGGQAAHEKGTAHEFTAEEAREAGRKGGEARHAGADQHAPKNRDEAPGTNRVQHAVEAERPRTKSQKS